jgi:VWFA-related protein
MKRTVVCISSFRIGTLPAHFCACLALASILLLGLGSAHAQACDSCSLSALAPGGATPVEFSMKKQVNEVNLFFVASQGKRFIDDLSMGDISIRDDRKPPAAILGFRTEKELPLRIGLLIDTSDSLHQRFRFEQAAAGAFLRRALMDPADEAFVMGFSGDQNLKQDFTHSSDLLTRAVKGLKVNGGTALYDAIRSSCELLLRHPEQEVVARVLVVLSDGQNNSGKATLEDAIDIAQRAEVTVYTISTAPPAVSPSDTNARDIHDGNQNLRRLAEDTGGRVLFPARPKDIERAFAKINEELRSRYAISYRPADFSADGRYRRISIAAKKAGKSLRVRARKGYYARPS